MGHGGPLGRWTLRSPALWPVELEFPTGSAWKAQGNLADTPQGLTPSPGRPGACQSRRAENGRGLKGSAGLVLAQRGCREGAALRLWLAGAEDRGSCRPLSRGSGKHWPVLSLPHSCAGRPQRAFLKRKCRRDGPALPAPPVRHVCCWAGQCALREALEPQEASAARRAER